MLQQLKKVDQFQDIQEDKFYSIHVEEYERFGVGGADMFFGKGTQIIEKLKNVFSIDEDDEEDDEWFNIAEERNGDGWDQVDVYEFEFLPTRG